MESASVAVGEDETSERESKTMNRRVIAKVIVTLLDLYVALPPSTHTSTPPPPQYTPTQEWTHALTRGGARKFFFSDERAARGGVQGGRGTNRAP